MMGEEFKVNTFTKKIGQITLVANCHANFAPQVKAFLSLIDNLFSKSGNLGDGVKIQIGWVIFTLIEKEINKLLVCQPDFEGDPLSGELDEEITTSLYVLKWQAALLAELKLEKKECNTLFYQKIIIQKGCLDEKELSVYRNEPGFEGDSGWFISSRTGSEMVFQTDDLESIYVYQLLNLRPSLLEVLVLPVGYLIGFTGNEITVIFNDKKQMISRGKKSNR
jgi:hypothetical protein